MKYAYLTCELLGRDLDSRLLIASYLVKQGVSCVVGQQWSMFSNAVSARRGVFLLKTANRVQGVQAQMLRDCGHKVAVSDEEVLAIDDADEIAAGTDVLTLANADLFLAQDERHKRIIGDMHPVPCEVVGNARVELMTRHLHVYHEQAAAIPRPFILFNTGFAAINSVWGGPERFAAVLFHVRGLDPLDPASHKIAQDCVDFETANHAIMAELIPWARDTFDRRVVVRPHPAERADTWAIPGVEVVGKSTSIPWLMAADVMVHNSSTTGLEAAILGTPCMNVNPLKDSRHGKISVASKVNLTVHTLASAKLALKALVDAPRTAAVPMDMPASGAEKTAAALAQMAPDGPRMDEWTVAARGAAQTEKFCIGTRDFVARARLMTQAHVTQIDDSTFLMEAEK